MINKNSTTIILGVFLLMNLYANANDTLSNRKPKEYTMREAIDKGILEYRISGFYDSRNLDEVIDNDGLHYGKCMVIVLQSKIDSLVLLRLDCGTQLVPEDSSIQTMIVTHKAILALYPKQTYATRLYAMCGQLHDKPPTVMDGFKVGELADSNVVKIATYLNDNYIQSMVGQHAIWSYTDHSTFDELKSYSADSVSIAMTKGILTNLKIETKLTPILPSPPIVVIPESIDILVNPYLFYGGMGLILILTTSVVVLIIKRKKNGNEKMFG